MSQLSLADALWNQRHFLAEHASEFRQLVQAIHEVSADRVPDMSLSQWISILAFVLEYQPDLIIELGRDYGNSTCCFLEAAGRVPNACHVVSLCRSSLWFDKTAAKLGMFRSQEWFARGTILQADFATIDVKPYLAAAKRVLVFWDAHGFDVAEYALAYLLPQLADRPHVVLVHDMTDLRYHEPPRRYESASLWRAKNGGDGSDDSYLWLGHICSRVAQVISITDFTTRNRIPFHSADHSLHCELINAPEKSAELKPLLADLFALDSHWFWFSPCEATSSVTYPHLTCEIPRPPVRVNKPEERSRRPFLGRLRGALSKRIAGWI